MHPWAQLDIAAAAQAKLSSATNGGPLKTLTPLEQEAIILGAVVGMVDDMVNHVIFCPLTDKNTDTNLMPQTSETLRQFAILLRDFLSPVKSRGDKPMPFDLPSPESSDRASDHTTLFYLARVCETPRIGTDVALLSDQVRGFSDWLDTTITVPKVWLSRIEVEVDLKIKRIDFIRIGGDIGKHNFLRLGGQAAKLRQILRAQNIEIDEGQAYAALPDCWDWFHTHLLAYHASTIAEFLNNIRYAIRLYVAPTATATYRVTYKIDDYVEAYTFDRPEEMTNAFAWAQYYALLDGARRRPNFPPFTVSRSMKDQF